ncbi:hypothetical protein Gotri_026015 [Gossypium trilobum]|uniref:Uncharacterized protein n=1 Tax=Gossypium trilobum TaxID=34281 RepID=A0A7J9FQX2_9ROSI|nr:hypothetical protein [Gossypium trilobum]
MLVNYASGTVSLVPSPFLSSDTSDVGNENGKAIESSQRDGNGTENGIVERDCVCDIVAHLPFFLSYHLHHCNFLVGEACKVTFTCGGRLRP